MESLEEILTELEEWLQTHKTDDRITPADWYDLPDELQDRLSNYARDAAVQRADDFAREGLIDLTIHEGIRELVNAMALVWTLKGSRVRTIVEEYIDELPAPSGREFIKLADQLFRHRSSARWQDLVKAIRFDHLAELVRNSLEEMNHGGKEVFDRALFLEQIGLAYSRWALRHPKEAVNEIIATVGESEEEEEEFALETILALMRMRGAEPLLRAIELEEEVGLTSLDRADMVRMIKRYALIVKREGGLPTGSRTRPRIELVDTEPETEDKTADVPTEPDPTVEEEPEEEVASEAEPEEEPPSGEVEADTEELQSEETAVVEPSSGRESDSEFDSFLSYSADIESSIDAGAGNEAASEQPADTEEDSTAAESEEPEKPEVEEDSSGFGSLSSEDEEAISSLFGGGEFETSKQEDKPAEPDERKEAIPEPEAGKEKAAVEEEDEAAGFFAEFGDEDEGASSNEASGANTEAREPTAASGAVEKDDSLKATTPAAELDQEEAKQEESAEGHASEKEEKDVFAELRRGDLHDRIVNQLYDGDSTLLEVFLAKVKGAPDWNRAKQLIANELFRCKVDLHSEIGEEFFLTLKRCMGAS